MIRDQPIVARGLRISRCRSMLSSSRNNAKQKTRSNVANGINLLIKRSLEAASVAKDIPCTRWDGIIVSDMWQCAATADLSYYPTNWWQLAGDAALDAVRNNNVLCVSLASYTNTQTQSISRTFHDSTVDGGRLQQTQTGHQRRAAKDRLGQLE